MKRKLTLFGITASNIISMFCSLYGTNKNIYEGNVAASRSGTLNIENTDPYFEYFEENNNDIEYKTIGKKKISSASLLEYETVSLLDDADYLITYEVIANVE